MKKLIPFYILFVIVATLPAKMWGQPVLDNNGNIVYLSQGAVVTVNGNTENSSGQLVNNGDLYLNGNITNNDTIAGYGHYMLTGDWINNALFIHDTSTVFLNGNDQNIGGSSSTVFYNLTLQGSGIKHLQINTFVDNILDLTSLELAADSFIIKINNTDTSAIHRTSGFVSTLSSGYLTRKTNQNAKYLFPVGSSVNTPRYRPVTIKPDNSGLNIFSASFVNHDANNDGLDRSLIDSTLCGAEPDFYHLIKRDSGNTNAQLTFFYDQTADGYWDGIANWQINHWAEIDSTTLQTGSPFNKITTPSINNFSYEPYILTVSTPVVELGDDTAFCSGSFLTLDAGSGYDSYLWNTGATTQSLQVDSAGVYSVTVTLNSCTATDDIKVSEHTIDYTLTGDSAICAGDTASITITTTADFIWSTGDTTSTIQVSPLSTTTYYVTISDTACSMTDSFTVTISPAPTVDAGPDQNICTGDSAILTATGQGSFLWNTGDTTSSITVTPDTNTIYFVTVTSGNGCSAYDSVTVNVLPPPVATVTNDTTICEGESVQLSASGGTNYHWEPSSLLSDPDIQNPIATPTSTTTFTVTVSNSACSDTASVTIYVLQAPTVDAGNDVEICAGDSATLSATGNGTFLWNTGETSQTITVSPTTSTTYTVTVTNDNGCSANDSVTVTVQPVPDADAGQDAAICYGQTVQLNASGGDSYSWSPSGTLSNPTIPDPVASPSVTTTYYVTISNGQCQDIDSVTVTVFPLPNVYAGEDTTITSGQSIQLNATTNATSPSFLWQPETFLSNNTIQNPVATPVYTITYTVTVTDIHGCSASDTITITVINKEAQDLVIYNTFTPNGDGINDTWHIEGIENYPDNFVQIYNRDGMKVYEKHGYNNEWDGKYYGNDLPAATYYYILDLGNGSDILKGHVTIIR